MYKSVTVDLKLYSYNVKLYMALYIYTNIQCSWIRSGCCRSCRLNLCSIACVKFSCGSRSIVFVREAPFILCYDAARRRSPRLHAFAGVIESPCADKHVLSSRTAPDVNASPKHVSLEDNSCISAYNNKPCTHCRKPCNND